MNTCRDCPDPRQDKKLAREKLAHRNLLKKRMTPKKLPRTKLLKRSNKSPAELECGYYRPFIHGSIRMIFTTTQTNQYRTRWNSTKRMRIATQITQIASVSPIRSVPPIPNCTRQIEGQLLWTKVMNTSQITQIAWNNKVLFMIRQTSWTATQ